MSPITSENGAQATTAIVSDPDALCSPARTCTPISQPLVPDVKKHLYQLLKDEPNEEKRLNIKAFISAFEKGEEIGFDELFCKGKRMKMDEWQPQLGPYFKFPLTLQSFPFTIYPEAAGRVAQQHIMFDITLSNLVGGLPTGPVMRISPLNDTGSDLLTLYTRDLNILDPFNHFVNAIGPIVPVRTAAGIVQRQTAVGAVRLLNGQSNAYLGGWFQEDFCIEADTPVLDANGVPVIDLAGNIVFEDLRLTGVGFRNRFYKGTGKRDGRLVISTVKSLLQPNLPA